MMSIPPDWYHAEGFIKRATEAIKRASSTGQKLHAEEAIQLLDEAKKLIADSIKSILIREAELESIASQSNDPLNKRS